MLANIPYSKKVYRKNVKILKLGILGTFTLLQLKPGEDVNISFTDFWDNTWSYISLEPMSQIMLNYVK